MHVSAPEGPYYNKLDAFDRLCRRQILRLFYIERITNEAIMRRARTDNFPQTAKMERFSDARLCYFRRVAPIAVQKTTATQSLLLSTFGLTRKGNENIRPADQEPPGWGL